MIEKVYDLLRVEERTIKAAVDDDNVAIMHMTLPKGEALPQHNANSNVYMIVVRGNLTLKLGDQEAHTYTSTQIVNIPYGTLMDVGNSHDEMLEFLVVKTPNPRNYKK